MSKEQPTDGAESSREDEEGEVRLCESEIEGNLAKLANATEVVNTSIPFRPGDCESHLNLRWSRMLKRSTS